MTAYPVDRARKLLEAATPGPWHVGHSPDGRDPVSYFAETYAHGEPGRVWLVCVPYQNKPLDEEALFTAITGNGPTSEANARLIAAAPQLLADLLAEVGRLERALLTCREAAEDGRLLGGAGARAGCAIVIACVDELNLKGPADGRDE